MTTRKKAAPAAKKTTKAPAAKKVTKKAAPAVNEAQTSKDVCDSTKKPHPLAGYGGQI